MATDRLPNHTQMETLNSHLSTIASKISDPYNSQHKLASDLVDDTNQTNKFATAAQLAQIETNENNILLLQKVSVTQVFYAATLTWNQSADGIYYSDGVSIAGISTIDSLLITGFSNLRATDVITPIVTNDRTKVRFTSNVNSFANNDTSMTLCIIGSG